ncbi:hypothetical protein DFQ30_000248 [Apophysomyces sp. BC1015]|nr:hypothetical protein DFQ30_000248 [Apophysomyces sp. BC1015]
MDIYSRPNRKGIVQQIRMNNRATTRPCWNLQSKHIGSLDVNDPMIKIYFYRSADCRGPSLTVSRPSQNLKKSVPKARSVSIIKIRPLLFVDQDHQDSL